MACVPSEDSDQSGHPPSLISLPCALSGWLRTQCFFMRTAKTLIRADAQADLSLRLSHMSFCWFSHEPVQFIFESINLQMKHRRKQHILVYIHHYPSSSSLFCIETMFSIKIEPHHEKTLWHMRTTKPQISLHICTV